MTCFSNGAFIRFGSVLRGSRLTAFWISEVGRAVAGSPPPCAFLPFVCYFPGCC